MNSIKIGITGGIGSGKSTIAYLVEQMGFPVFYADKEAQDIINNDFVVQQQLIQLLGNDSFTNRKYNRPYVAKLVFNNPELLKQLNHIVHPAVLNRFKQWSEQQQNRFVFLESAILFESGWESYFDIIINVEASIPTRIERVRHRDNLSYEQIRARIANQMSDDTRRERSHYTIYNDDNHPVLQQLLKILKDI